jgi:hypothetical protein
MYRSFLCYEEVLIHLIGWDCFRSRFWPSSLPSTVLIIALEMILGCAGAAYGTAKSGIGIAGVGTFRPDLIMKVWIIHTLLPLSN